MIIRVIDVETCGFPPDDAQIVEIGSVDLDTDSGARGLMWSSLVNPGCPIPPQASAVHHITDEMVADAPPFHELVPRIMSGADVFAAHNVRFDLDCLSRAENPVYTEPEMAPQDTVPVFFRQLRWICTYKCSVLLFPDAPSHNNQVLRYWLHLKLADPSLAQPHRALGDAYVTAALLRCFLRSAPVDDMIDVSSKPVMLPRLHFGEHAGKPIEEVPTSYFEWIVNKSKGPWDEDVLYTAKTLLAERRVAQRSRSPV